MTERMLADAPLDATRNARLLLAPDGSVRVALVNLTTGAEFASIPLADRTKEGLAKVMETVKAVRARLAQAPAAPRAAPHVDTETMRGIDALAFAAMTGGYPLVDGVPTPIRAARLISYDRPESISFTAQIEPQRWSAAQEKEAARRAAMEVGRSMRRDEASRMEPSREEMTAILRIMRRQVSLWEERQGRKVPEASRAPAAPAPKAAKAAPRRVATLGAGTPEPVRPRVVFTRRGFGAGAPDDLRPRPVQDPPRDAARLEASAAAGAIFASNDVPNVETKTTGTKWSTYQRAVFKWIAAGTRNIVIRAVAGSGKTTTIMQSLAEIDASDSVLMVAFNKTIQKELAARIPKGIDNVTVSTLAAWGYTILRRYWPGTEMLSHKGSGGNVCVQARDMHVFNVGLGADKEGLKWRDMSKKDWAGYYRMLEELDKLMGLCESFLAMTPEAIRAVEKDYELFGDDFRWQGMWREYTNEDVIGWVLRAQRERLTQPPAGAAYARDTVIESGKLKSYIGIYDELTNDGQKSFCSFRDMSFVVAATASMEPPKRYSRVYVDETQDMDVAQTEIILRSVEQPNGRVIVVGDEDQAIYRFRGADSDSMSRLARILKAVELPLSESYRVPTCAAEEARTIVPAFSVPAKTLSGEPWPEGHCSRINAKAMAATWREGDIVITRVNDTLMPMAMLAISRGITPIIMGEGTGVAWQIRQTFDAILKTHGLTKKAPIERFHPALVAYYEKAEANIFADIAKYIDEKEVDYGKDYKKWELKGKKGYPPRKWWIPASAKNLGKREQRDAAIAEMAGNSTDYANLRLVFDAFWTSQETGLSQRPGFVTVGDISGVVDRLAPSEKEIEDMSPEEYKALLESRLVLTSVHRIKGGEANRVFILTETFKYAFGRWQKRSPNSPKAQREEKNLWYVAVTRVRALPGVADSGDLYYVSGLRGLLGKDRQWEVEAGAS